MRALESELSPLLRLQLVSKHCYEKTAINLSSFGLKMFKAKGEVSPNYLQEDSARDGGSEEVCLDNHSKFCTFVTRLTVGENLYIEFT